MKNTIELAITMAVGLILGGLLFVLTECSFDYDSNYYQHDKCLLNEQCVTEGMQIYDPGIEDCPACLECTDNVWVEIDCGEFSE